ncbi:ubiquinone/menaquinone biosynthesis C-methylase UbiE [Constrictibacter sp. MBR-5]|jgi:ubiquinone/menaquinone biosynthesis C-methylase UbiE|uniref:class I SAM-dependent methyltransferase n=1 Tax=Constrictibacter sp. MBR-5 TaxID=3156467 RepID=UPI0033967C2A
MSVYVADDPVAYEAFMGRWSRRLAPRLIAHAGIAAGDHVLDLGCGTGTLTEALADHGAAVTAVDFSQAYADHTAARLAGRAVVEQGDARSLRFGDGAFDAAMASLVLDTIPEADRAVAEMRRVVRPGGTVAAGVFDYWGGYGVFALLWDIAAVLDEAGRALRDELLSHPLPRAGALTGLWRAAGMAEVEEVPVVLSFDYADFADYWSTFETGQGRTGRYVLSLSPPARERLRGHAEAAYRAAMPDGPRSFAVIVRAVRGRVP